jgi:hypothetical protein
MEKTHSEQYPGLLGLAQAVTSKQVHCHGKFVTALQHGNQVFFKTAKAFPENRRKIGNVVP